MHWLVENNPLYSDVFIDPVKLGKLPQNGQLQRVATHNVQANGEFDSETLYDSGPYDNDLNDNVYSDEAKVTSFTPAYEDQKNLMQ